MDQTFADALKRLEGEQLSSVEFVLQDYVQLRFNGPCLNAYNRHWITSGPSKIMWGEPGYCDALCKLAAHTVQKTKLTDEELTIAFDNNEAWIMSLRNEDYRGPEAFYFTDHTGTFWAD